MNQFNLYEYLSESEFNKEVLPLFQNSYLERCIYNRHTRKVIFHLYIPCAVKMDVYKSLCEFFEEILESEVKIYIRSESWNLDKSQIEEYLQLSCAMNKESMPYYDDLALEENKMIFSFDSPIGAAQAESCL